VFALNAELKYCIAQAHPAEMKNVPIVGLRCYEKVLIIIS
jgi:hypothetical protein